jgi:hypothetical protein
MQEAAQRAGAGEAGEEEGDPMPILRLTLEIEVPVDDAVNALAEGLGGPGTMIQGVLTSPWHRDEEGRLCRRIDASPYFFYPQVPRRRTPGAIRIGGRV